MKLFKRISIFVLLAAIVALASFWIFVQHARNKSYETMIHKDAAMLIKVDVYGLYKQLLPDYIKGKSRKRSGFLKGIDMPANAFIYNLKNKSATTLVATLPIENIDSLLKSLNSPMWQQTQQAGTFTSVYSADEKWHLVFSKEQIAISFSLNREDVESILIDILNKKNTVTVAESRFNEIAKQEGHVTFRQDKNTATANFTDGGIEIDFALETTAIKPKQDISRQKFAKDNALSMWLYADVNSALVGKVFNIDTFTIVSDSLLAANPTGIELAVTKGVMQRDSIVTYDYNDDFEKVATVTVKETAIPGLTATLYAKGNAIRNYLQRQGITTNDGISVSRQFFPLYQLYTQGSEDAFTVSTLKIADNNKSIVKETEFLGLDANVPQLLTQPGFAMLKPYGKLLSTIKVRGQSGGNNIIKGTASICFLNKDKNALLQLY